jgi:lipoteichoic acid synthase
MTAGFKFTDLYYIFIAILFFWLYIKSKQHDINTHSLRTSIYIWLCSIGLALASHSFYLLNSAHAFESVLTKTVFSGPKFDSMWPNWTYFHKGFFRKYVLDPLTYGDNMKLTKEQEEEIEEYYSDQSQRVSGRTAPDNVKNVIFILVESYLAVTSDLFVDGQEITPHLNQLKRDSNVYYNGHMQPNVSIGESSDGQLIYMSGLLPLHSEITVSKARKNTLIGLPTQMQKKYQDLSSLTIIPTNPTLWDQQAMTEAYGFQNLYSTLDYQKDMQVNISEDFLSDEMIFTYALKKDQLSNSPFCSLILTMSMHQPYNSYVEHGFHLTDKTLPQEYKNYLMSCHYTDIQIGKYLKSLKEKGLYDNSLIIIAADHDAHQDYLGMEGKISRDIPLFIVNGGIDSSNAWTGTCNQLDVYTTILDIMGVECQWRGLGHTLLTNDYHNSVTEEAQQLSDWIIYSDYFKNKTIQ